MAAHICIFTDVRLFIDHLQVLARVAKRHKCACTCGNLSENVLLPANCTRIMGKTLFSAVEE